MSTESLKRVLLKIKGQAREMRKEKLSKRLAPKKPEEKKGDGDGGESTIEAIRGLLEKA